MSKMSLAVGLLLIAVPWDSIAQDKPKPGYAKKDELSLTITLGKKVYKPNEEILLSFRLKNESDKVIFIGDWSLAPDFFDGGKGSHYEVHLTADKKPLDYWSPIRVEGFTLGIRKVFKLKPGEEYKGFFRISSGVPADQEKKLLHEKRGGIIKDRETKKNHVVGKDGRHYTVALLYRSNPIYNEIWMPPADFQKALFWNGTLLSSPISFEITPRSLSR